MQILILDLWMGGQGSPFLIGDTDTDTSDHTWRTEFSHQSTSLLPLLYWLLTVYWLMSQLRVTGFIMGLFFVAVVFAVSSPCLYTYTSAVQWHWTTCSFWSRSCYGTFCLLSSSTFSPCQSLWYTTYIIFRWVIVSYLAYKSPSATFIPPCIKMIGLFEVEQTCIYG